MATNLSTVKTCSVCHVEHQRPRSAMCSRRCVHQDYYRRNYKMLNAKACKWARDNRDKKLATQRAWSKAHPKSRWYQLKSKYGVDEDMYVRLLARQEGRCAVCQTSFPGRAYFDVDHNHQSGQVRGLLCYSCNRGLGFFGDDSKRVAAALTYLIQSR